MPVPPVIGTPRIPAMNVALWVPFVPMRMVFASATSARVSYFDIIVARVETSAPAPRPRRCCYCRSCCLKSAAAPMAVLSLPAGVLLSAPEPGGDVAAAGFVAYERRRTGGRVGEAGGVVIRAH